MMNVGILTIGDELLIGQVVNTNASSIASACTSAGARVTVQSTVADGIETIVAELRRLVDSDLDAIITTGGLGPTHDDYTMKAVATFLQVDIVSDPQWLQHLEKWMSSLGRDLSSRNAAQALVPRGAAVFYSSVGTAPGFSVLVPTNRGTCMLFVLPGVPREMQTLMDAEVVPWVGRAIEENYEEVTEYHTLLSVGIPESALADLLGNPDSFLRGGTLAFLPSTSGIRLRIGVTGKGQSVRTDEIHRIEQYIRERAGAWIIGDANATLQETVGARLLQMQATVSVAESCTGGMLGGAFTDVPGSSAWFEGGVITYSNHAKVRDLGVLESALLEHGAVSSQVAEQMAAGVRQRFGTTYGIGVTGVAGPDGGSAEKPVGTVWIAVANKGNVISQQHLFTNNRKANRERSVTAALLLLWQNLES